jgi:pimeloyl-ACP methyl ester carboxylesterase
VVPLEEIDGVPIWFEELGEIRSVMVPTLLVTGDRDVVCLDHADEMLEPFPDRRLAVLPGTEHAEILQRSEQLRALAGPFRSRGRQERSRR